jgi:hypothetical protein
MEVNHGHGQPYLAMIMVIQGQPQLTMVMYY